MSSKYLRTELIHVAAVAVAAIEDLGREHYATCDDALQAVHEERARQFVKWGDQRHSPAEWLVILGEEYGEACRAVLEGVRDHE